VVLPFIGGVVDDDETYIFCAQTMMMVMVMVVMVMVVMVMMVMVVMMMVMMVMMVVMMMMMETSRPQTPSDEPTQTSRQLRKPQDAPASAAGGGLLSGIPDAEPNTVWVWH